MRRAVLLAPLAVLVMTSCGGDDDAASDSAAAPSVSEVPSGASTPTTPGSGPLRPAPETVSPDPGPSAPTTSARPASGPQGTPEELAAVADLAAREGVDPSAITVISTDEVTWRDGSMGCPEPGMNYTQALVPGIRVVLELDGVRYEYHAGGARSIFLCANPQPPAEG